MIPPEPRPSSQARGRAWRAARIGVPLLLAVLVLAWWAGDDDDARAQAGATQDAAAARTPAPSGEDATSRAASAAASGTGPWSAQGEQQRQMELALWSERLQRAQVTLDTYRRSTRYPHRSQPAAAPLAQLYPNRPIVEEHAAGLPGQRKIDGLRLRTLQERVFVQGRESVLMSVAAVDRQGAVQPLRVLRATVREFVLPGTASLYPVLPLDFNDRGADGDSVAGDGTHSLRLQPATQGFVGLHGHLRVEVYVELARQQAFVYFDLMVTPEPPADWAGPVRERLQEGSLVFELPVTVHQPGRYVVTGRVDDARGQPFALLTFNDEVGAGPGAFRLVLFGLLVHDGQPAFPLTLRDVEAFLLHADASPDRSLMPRRSGTLHVSAAHPLQVFSRDEWSSEERDRYLAELARDVAQAETRVESLGGGR